MMKNMKHAETSESRKLTGRRAAGYYTILFFATAACIFAILILLHKSVIQYSDGYKQAYFWVVEVKQQIADLFNGEGFHMWSWNKGLGMNTSIGHLIDPFMVIAALFPAGYIELGYSVGTVLKMYVGGLAFLAFTRQIKMIDFNGIFGSLCYAFSAWFIEVALCQSSFLMNAYLFPLLALTVERVYQGKSPVWFIAVVAYYMIRNFYFSYMAAIVIIIFIVLRYFAYNEEFRIKHFAATIGKFIAFGISGCLISCFTMLTSVTDLSNSSTDSATDTTALLFGQNYYLGFGERLLARGMTDDYLDIGLPIIVLLLLPVAVRKMSRKSTHIIMTLILFGMMLLPIFCSMFNAFGYPTLRWSFTFIFFAVWAAMDVLNPEELQEKKNLIIMAIALVCIAAWTIIPVFMGVVTFGPTAWFFVPWNIFAGIVLLVCIGAKARKWLLVFFTLGALIVGWNWAFLHHGKDFLRNNQINTQLEESTQRAGSLIEDDGFYRIDQVDGLQLHHQMKYPANENTWWDTKCIYIYNSKLPGKLLEFNKSVGNNYGYLKRVYVMSNDNRMGLDFLQGVKYFLGDDTKNGVTGSDEYAGYGFEYYDTLDGVNVFKNKYDTGIGFAYDKCIKESQFLKLSRLEREQALLQAVVIPDEEETTVETIKAKDIETDIEDIPYEIVATDGAIIEENKIIATKEDSSFTISVSGVSDSQLIVSFDNLIHMGSSDIDLSCSNYKVFQMAMNDSSNQTIPGICNYDLNMGYYDSYSGTIKITIGDPGEYSFDKLYVSAMSVDNYDKYALQRMEDKFEISSYCEEEVEGSVDLDKESIVYFSIPVYSNWQFYVDGKHVKKIQNANVAFVGVEVPEGEHEIRLQYEYKYHDIGLLASVIGLVMMVISGILFKFGKKRKERRDCEK